MDSGAPVIQLLGIRKEYCLEGESIVALNDVDLTIGRNEFVAITGPSGSGKSTLMSVLGCLATPSSGNYFLDGRDVANLSELALASVRNRSVGFIFQSFNLMPKLNVLQNVIYPLKYRYMRSSERVEMAREALDKVALGSRLKHLPNQLSGGQRQRVAIARALVTNPDILLADEPTGNLDSKTTEQIMLLFENLHNKGQTIVMVTHENEIAKRCQREVCLVDGDIRSDVSRYMPHGQRRDEGAVKCFG